MKRNNQTGFTLVELLIVIGIIAVLVSILLPALNKARQQASTLRCLSTLRQFQLYNQMYSMENRNQYFPILEQSPGYVFTAPTTSKVWSQEPVVRKFMQIIPMNMAWDSEAQREYICNEATYCLQAGGYNNGRYKIALSYGMNYTDWADPADLSLWYAATPNQPAISYKASRIRKPSEKIAWADAMGPWTRKASSNLYTGEATGDGTRIAYRHQGGVNIAFFDGHAERLMRKEVDQNMLTTARANALWYAYK